MKIPVDKIRDVIGPGGKVIRSIVEESGAKIDVEDDGTILIASSDGEALQKAVTRVEQITAEAEVGKIYHGKVRKIMDFGAFIEIIPGTDGLCHISQLAPYRVGQVTDILSEGDDNVPVKVLEIDRNGKIRLSRREAMAELGLEDEGRPGAVEGGAPPERDRGDRGDRGDRRGGGRGRGRRREGEASTSQ